MPDRSIVVAQPAAATQLVLLFHGVGSSAANLVPLAEAIAKARGDAMVVSVDGPRSSTLGSGREWFSVVGITEDNRLGRIAEVLPLFQQTVAHWQQASGIGPAATTLVGFSQGAILALESTQVDAAPIASRVIALAGRFAEPVRRAPPGMRLHLIHGEQDPVVPARYSVDAAHALASLGATTTLEILPGLGHSIDARVLGLVLGHLS